MEVRCVALAELDLTPSSVVWDVGAGSGSLAIEAARLAYQGQVFAIEMDAEDYGLIVENAQQIDCPALVPVLGQAPQAWKDLPDPDAVFVGGAGRAAADIVQAACGRLGVGSRLVVNVVSVSNLTAVRDVIEKSGMRAQVRMLSTSHGVDSLGDLRFEATNPSFLITATCEHPIG